VDVKCGHNGNETILLDDITEEMGVISRDFENELMEG
jgi:hypothetical protein